MDSGGYKQVSSKAKKMKPKVTHIDFEELDLPDKVYKYRTWTDGNHKTILTNQIVYMSSPFDFEDPKDCKSQKQYDSLTDKDIYNHYLEDSQEKNPERTRQQHRKYARDWFKKSPMRYPEYIKEKQIKYLQEFAEHFGILSLTANPNSHAMWSKYSDNHHGICIGFNPQLMFKYLGGGCKVDYSDELPIIYPNDSFEKEHYKQIFCKEKKWEFEKEYRTHMFYPEIATKEDRQIKVPKECYIEIIFGYNTTDDFKNEIRETCRTQGLNVNFKQVISIANNETTISPAANKGA